eukprot:828390-Amphidinium_carterae.1
MVALSDSRSLGSLACGLDYPRLDVTIETHYITTSSRTLRRVYGSHSHHTGIPVSHLRMTKT